MTDELYWTKLLNTERFSNINNRPKAASNTNRPPSIGVDNRTEIERDHDRILFSTPLRRMGDKTQVFPLESIESVRTRLTHSYEVSNLARSIGVQIAEWLEKEHGIDERRNIPAALAAVGLAHDMGNPPFGHQGENAIRSWFERNAERLWGTSKKRDADEEEDLKHFNEAHKNDFLNFEGNAQTLRLLTRLQVISDDLGLNLTVGTIASTMKYVVGSDKTCKDVQASKKVGFFQSEQEIVRTVREKTGLLRLSRHPLALLMEACDDIAYSVLDAEDSVKKGLVSYNDLIAWLERENPNDHVVKYVCDSSKADYSKFAKNRLQPGELDDISTQKFRVIAIGAMVNSVISTFKEQYRSIMRGSFSGELIKESPAGKLCQSLKGFDYQNAFLQQPVLQIELEGYNVINKLMDFLWIGISSRNDYKDLTSKRPDPFANYVYSRISRNYRRVFEGLENQYHTSVNLPIRYRELQLLTDMVSGMTDRFCIELYNDLNAHYVSFNE